MRETGQQRISKIRLGAARAALTSAVVLVFGVVSASSAHAQTLTDLYNFTGGHDGGSPSAGLIRDAAGNLYGTTYWNGSGGWGTVFKVDTTGTETVLYNFTGGTDGANPIAGVIRDAAGNLYGTTYSGGAHNWGAVFKVDTAGTETVLYSFAGGVADGCSSYQGLVRDKAGNLYGTTEQCGSTGHGVVFQISPAGAETVLHHFAAGSSDGAYPVYGSLLMDKLGNLYGTAQQGGASGQGVVYKLSKSGTMKLLHSFAGGTKDGCFPDGSVAQDKSGNAGVFSTIYTYDNAHGIFAGGVMQASDGNLYAVAGSGGINNNGTIIKLTTTGTLLNYYAFPGGGSGSFPGGLTEASDGNLYGSTSLGGVKNNGGIGTIFRYTKQGKLTYLYSFNPKNTTGGSQPSSGLIQATDGYLYGLTLQGGTYYLGTLFRISTSGAFQQLYSFPTAIGTAPAALMQSTSGLMYGSAFNGGRYGFGAIFSVDMGLGPFITFVQPTGKVGHQVQILGQGLTGATSVSFNGVPDTSFSVTSDTYMTAVVPAGATTGPVVVTTPSGTLTSNPVLRITK